MSILAKPKIKPGKNSKKVIVTIMLSFPFYEKIICYDNFFHFFSEKLFGDFCVL